MRWLAVPLIMVLAVSGSAGPRDTAPPAPTTNFLGPSHASPIPVTPRPSLSRRPPRKLDATKLRKTLDRQLAGRHLSMVVRDLTTGQTFRYRPGTRFVTASVVKVDIVMTLLLQAQRKKRKLDGYERRLAAQAIRYSDNKATDRLWERIGGAGPLASANRRFGLKTTRTVDGKCVDLYCWGITDTTAEDQVRLLTALIREDSPLTAANRAYVLGLMAKVAPEQRWGVSAAARRGDPVALKNGWQRRLAHGKLWAINSVGRVRLAGHDLLIAVLSDHHATSAAGITVVERAVRIAAAHFRRID